MCLKIYILVVALLINKIHGVIYHLNDTEFQKMPPIYKLDDYKACLRSPSDVYCNVDFNLISDSESDLLNMINEYSEQIPSHFNHSELYYGVCVTKQCEHYINDSKVLKTDIEKCLNNTFVKEYGLGAEVKNFNCHSLSDAQKEYDTADIAVALLLLLIIMLNVFGTLYDCKNNEEIKGNNFLLCFSISRNWKRLTSFTPSCDPRIKYLKGLNGIRCLILFGVIVVHSTWPYTRAVENVHDFELSFYNIRQNVIMNGSLIIQFNFLITGFLLAHNTGIFSENHDISWYIIPKGIIVRYFRITPVYGVVIAVCATLMKYLEGGPLWQVSGDVIHSHCRSDWWRNLLYINNYKYNSQCLPHCWYLGADMQLFCLGIVLCLVMKNKSFRNMVLTSVLLLGIILIAVHTYVRDLDAILIMAPGRYKALFDTDPTFNGTYKMGHNNVPSFIIGMMLGYYVYERKDVEIYRSNNKMLKYMYWALLPLSASLIFSGELFYRDAPRDPLFVRVLYAAVSKPLFACLMAMLTLGTIFKIENVYRRVLENDIWIIPSRLSYCVYMIHMVFITLYVGLSRSLLIFTNFNLFVVSVCMTLISFIAAVPLWLLVETPFTELIKCYFIKTQQKKPVKNDCKQT